MRKENFLHLVEAVVYIALLVFFTYSGVLANGLKGSTVFWSEYGSGQASLFALVTNLGLLFLLAIDNNFGNRSSVVDWLPCFIAFSIAAVFTYGHAQVVTNPTIYQDYVLLLKFPRLYAIIHMCMIVYLVYLKYQTLREYTAKSI